jgi:tRNA(fMet)-specific endonuclease VapC
VTYFLDTNMCIYYLKGLNPRVKEVLLGKIPDEVKIPSVVKAELLFGAHKSRDTKNNTERVMEFLFPFEIIPFDDKETYVYARIRADLERRGAPVGPNDLLIASIVLANDGVLVTNNESEFGRIPGLRLENWSRQCSPPSP